MCFAEADNKLCSVLHRTKLSPAAYRSRAVAVTNTEWRATAADNDGDNDDDVAVNKLE